MTLFAKWVKYATVYESFESYSEYTGWDAWSNSTTPSLCTEGGKSLKIGVASKKTFNENFATVCKNKIFTKSGNGLAFWVKSEIATEIRIAFNDQNKTYAVNVPAGKSYVTVPWKEFTTLPDGNAWNPMFLRIPTRENNLTNTVYIDDIGTYVVKTAPLNPNAEDIAYLFRSILSGTLSDLSNDYTGDGIVDIRDLVRVKKLAGAATLDKEIPLARGVNMSMFEFEEGMTTSRDHLIFDKTTYEEIKAKGFDHIRLPVDFFLVTGEAPDYTIDPTFFEMVNDVVDLSMSAGLKTIIDFHHFGELQTNVNGNKQRYYKVWEQIAKRFQNYSEALVFELLNEPGNWGAIKNGGPDVVTPAKIMEIQYGAIDVIRKTNPTRLIVISPCWNNNPLTLKDTVLPDDDNLILSVHLYEPMEFTHQGAAWALEDPTVKCAFTQEVIDAMMPYIDAIRDFREETGKPVYVGEFGTMRNIIDLEERNKYAEFMVDLYRELKIGWCWWEFYSGFGLYSPKNRTWVGGTAEALLQ